MSTKIKEQPVPEGKTLNKWHFYRRNYAQVSPSTPNQGLYNGDMLPLSPPGPHTTLDRGSEALQILTDVIFCSSVRPDVRVMITVNCEQKCVLLWVKGRALLQVHQRLGIGKYRCSTIRGSVPKEETDKSQPISRCSETGICMSHLDQRSLTGSFTTDPISALTLWWSIQKSRRLCP